ncbi:MAG: serine/threonine protein kinase [Candidatus Eisenbacteria bacterium]|uniref:Serine/threonine protein kinase n=1 Tax=Eiseniibacteriota bacterium TaxID=2212470 RepID=A0A956NG25_UNCEI|nr:serine/threonine protein kinase [Candidatus Eisenbacteria bacterium]MCB9464466.1 serine/threonine protein kinase [Candidatus Eisenbacteria bacterium]
MSEDDKNRDREAYEREKREFFDALDHNESEEDAHDLALQRLLEHHRRGDGALDDPSGAASLFRIASDDSPGPIADYEILELLGRGGMGVVYRARRRSTDEVVALKFLRPSLASVAFRERFAREIEALQRLDHPGVCRLVEAGTCSTALGEVPFLAMEFVAGGPLTEEAARRDLPLASRLAILAHVFDIVDHAHGRGVIHRDLKPQNILLDDADRPHVVDFGIASLALPDAEAPYDEESMVLLGSISYMSPEQLHTGFGPVDARSDIFSLGAVGYELLSGRLPFGSPKDPPPRVLAAILLDPVPTLDEPVTSVLPGGVSEVIERCLAKNSGERYPSAKAAGEDLRRCLAGSLPNAVRRRSKVSEFEEPTRRNRHHATVGSGRVRLAILLVSVVLVATALLVLQLTETHSPDTVTAEVLSELELADEGIHLGVRTEASLESAIEALRRARAQLGYLSGEPYAPALERYINWRNGEALLFLGGIHDDPASFDAARLRFQEADAFQADDAGVTGLDPTRRIVGRIAGVERYHPAGGQAYAHSVLASWSDTRRHRELAASFRWVAIQIWADDHDLRDRPYDVPHPDPFLFHDYGRALVELGRETGEVDAVERGLVSLQHVDADTLWGEAERFGRAVHHESIALALATIDELRDGDRHAPEVASRMRRAASARGGEAKVSQAGTDLLEARLALERSDRIEQDPSLLTDALQSCRNACTTLAAAERSRAWQLGTILLARIEARTESSSSGTRVESPIVASSRSTLNQVEGRLDPMNDPLVAARWHLAAAEIAWLRGSPNEVVEHELAQLAEQTTPDQSPRLWHRGEAIRRSLISKPEGSKRDRSSLMPFRSNDVSGRP